MNHCIARRIAFALVFASQFVGAQTDAALWRYVHPAAKAVIGIDWKKIQQSSAGLMLQERIAGGSLPIPGADFLKDVDRVLISSPGSAGDEQSEPPILIAVRGRFNQDVRKALVDHGAKRQMYGEIPIYRPQGKNGKDVGFALPDAQTILIGDIASLTSSLGRNEFTPADPSPTVARALVMDPLYDLWAVVATPAALGNERLMGFLAGSDFGEETQGFEAGVSFRDGLTMNIGINARSEAAAKKLSSELSKILKLSAKDQPTNPALAELEKKMKVAAEKGAVSITLHLTKEELEKNTKLFEASRRPKPNPVADAKPMVKPPPQKMVIRIDGLDTGTREIPFKPERDN